MTNTKFKLVVFDQDGVLVLSDAWMTWPGL